MVLKLFFRLVLAILLCLSGVELNAQDRSGSALKDTTQAELLPVVTSARSLSAGRQKNTAVYGDYIELTVENIDVLLKMADSAALINKDSAIILCINNFPRNELALTDVNLSTNTLVFHLDRHSSTLTKLRIYFTRLWGKLEIKHLSVAIVGQKPINTKVTQFYLLLTSRQIVVFVIAFIIFIIVSLVYLVKKTNIIRVGADGSPFSLSQSQLAFWTLLVSFSIIYVWSVTEELPRITFSTLALLGISVGTTAGAKMVTYSKKLPVTYKQSCGFFIDILSDDTSLNIHRFQLMIWTLIMGVIFIFRVIDQLTIPEFSEDLLILMGISSGTYVLLKNGERTTTTETPCAAANEPCPPASEPETPAFG